MKRNLTLLSFAGASFFIGMIGMPGYAKDRTTPSRQQADSQIQTFVGVLEGTNEPREWINFIIYDDARKSNFFLDDDWKAERFIGHVVKVTETLDEKNRIIHLKLIEEVKWGLST
jgi:hypothetical protein